MTRKQQKLFRTAVDLFIELVKQVTNRKTMNYQCADADVKSFEMFLEEFGDDIGENFLREFGEFNIRFFFTGDDNQYDNSRSIRFNWLYGKSSIKRWNKVNKRERVRAVRKDIKKRVKINVVKKSSSMALMLNSLKPVEENFKAQFHNTKKGLSWCVANTTLYFHKSALCVSCNFRDDCKEILRTEFPKVYNIRGYGEE